MNLGALRVDREIQEELVIGEYAPLTQTDIVLLTEDRGHGIGSEGRPALKRITERHHALARIIAEGTMSLEQAAIAVGLMYDTVRVLTCDPSFKELVIFYRDDIKDGYRELHSRLVSISMEAAEELQRRLEESPSELGAAFLLDVVVKAADRTGHGPSSSTKTEVNVNINLADRMRAAREAATRATQIEGTVTRSEPDGE